MSHRDLARLAAAVHIVAPPRRAASTRSLTAFLALAVGIVVLDLFAAQPLIGPIGASFGIAAGGASIAATVTMLGYAAGLVILVPLIDLLENRRLILAVLLADMGALWVAAATPSLTLFLVASFAVGVTSSVIQMLVPMAAFLTPEESRGRVIGNLMSGIMLGILLSRPIASLVADAFGWRAFYGLSAVPIGAVALLLARLLPQRQPAPRPRYARLLISLWTLLRDEPVLRRRTLAAGLAMVAFSLFWTVVALRLAAPPFDLGQAGIAVFAFAGAAAVVATPLAGSAGDRGWARPVGILAHLGIVLAMLIAGIAGGGWLGFDLDAAPAVSLGLLVLSVFLLDGGVVTEQTLGRRAVNLLRPEARGRLNGLFTGGFFLLGAAGAALSGLAWSIGGWTAVCALGILVGASLLLLDLAEARRPLR
jgi:predicted MFS family arabinose efflux permease